MYTNDRLFKQGIQTDEMYVLCQDKNKVATVMKLFTIYAFLRRQLISHYTLLKTRKVGIVDIVAQTSILHMAD